MRTEKIFAGKTLAILSGGGDTPAINSSIESVRNRLESLKGHDVKFQVNKGRKRYVSFFGKVVATYPSVFTICTEDEDRKEKSYSYTEILCGNVKVSTRV